ncbi:Ku protein [Pseudomonas sp. RIT-PI-S]|uniref:non-homologous end joining protein Ku n=1 Tax=Pseudomonas sp. RIT-PI-S TaxID=3035295 RepID=UPI0021DA23EC|nr:Ku protein [Pseudomonas sp. RIT-PI-S]
MPRAIWKGAVSFGLVHIPVALVSATASKGVDFDWLDKRSMDPVGYKRVNKVTGEEMESENVVKGVAYEKGRYVVLSEEEIRAAHPVSTQTIEIFSFVDSSQIPLPNIDTPYYLAPDRRGEKVYALLRETLRQTDKVALALVVLHTRQYLAALMPLEDALVLVKLRWPAEVRSLETLELSSEVKKVELKKGELEMAKRLVEDMSGEWTPEDYVDQFEAKIMELVDRKAHEGNIEEVESVEQASGKQGADVIDLTELLKRSLGGKTTSKPAAKAPEEKAPAPTKSKARTPRKSRKAS